MKEPEPQELEHYHRLVQYFLAVAECWFLGRPYVLGDLSHALSEPNRLAIKLTQNQQFSPNLPRFVGLRLDQRRHILNEVFDQNVNEAHKCFPILKITLIGVALIGRAGYTLKQYEETLAGYFNESYAELKTIFERIFSFIPMSDMVGDRLDVGETMVEYFWESILGERDLPLTDTIKNSLGVESREQTNINPIDIIERVLQIFVEPDKPEAKRFLKSMVLSWLNEEYQKNRGRSKAAINKAIMENVMHKAALKEDAEGNKTIVEPEDRSAIEDFEQADKYLLLRNVLEVVTDPSDKRAFELYWAHELGDLNDDQYAQEAAKYGLTKKAIEHRLSDLTRKYPVLQQFNN